MNLFYRDIVITVVPDDVLFFMKNMLLLVHDKQHRLDCAISFPNWEDGEPNNILKFDTRVSGAKLGRVLRLFAKNAEVLEAIPQILGITDLIKKDVIYLTPVALAPTTEKSVCYTRNRGADHATRDSRRPEVTADKAREISAKLLETRHTLAYVALESKSNKQQFSVFIERKLSDTPPDVTNWGINGFGISRAISPCYLPQF